MKTGTIVSFPNLTCFEINIDIGSFDKAEPSVRRGQKAAGGERFSAYPRY
jgi:hypothetical protein